MKPMKVVLTEQLDDKVRRKAAALKGLRKGVLSEVVSEALENWVGSEPELYVGVFEDGMSLELPPKIVPAFLEILVETLRPGKTRIHTRVEGEEIMKEIPSKHLLQVLREAGISPLSSDFMAEIGEVRLFTGGGGCISMEGSLPAKIRLQITRSLLSKTGVRGTLSRKIPLHLRVREGRVEVL